MLSISNLHGDFLSKIGMSSTKNLQVELQKTQINWDWNIIFNEIPTPSPIVPKKHYLETGSLRWFERRIVPIDHFDQIIENVSNFKLMKNCTGLFLLFVPNSKDTQKTFQKKINEIKTTEIPNIELIVGSSDIVEGLSIVNLALEIASLKRIPLQNEAIKDDRVARNEFNTRLNLAEKKLSETLNFCFESAHWVYKNKPLKTISLSELSSHISDEIYKYTPRVSNELINRDLPSGIAVGGRAKLISHMVNQSNEENLGITGNPPELSFYLNIIKSAGMHKKSVDGLLQFTKPKKDSSLVKLYESLDKLLSNMKRLSIYDIYSTWAKPPYGVKSGIMPILLISFYLSRVDEIALYEEDTF